MSHVALVSGAVGDRLRAQLLKIFDVLQYSNFASRLANICLTQAERQGRSFVETFDFAIRTNHNDRNVDRVENPEN
ncbi:MAG TPA: hypothetical protein VKA78_02155, partial [Pyrinomonadaceae bacterium]|nr:hypothetical protein [Pyrinomonadaceae bacterium]